MSNSERNAQFQAAMTATTQDYLERIQAVAEEFQLDYLHVLWEELRLLIKLAVFSDPASSFPEES